MQVLLLLLNTIIITIVAVIIMIVTIVLMLVTMIMIRSSIGTTCPTDSSTSHLSQSTSPKVNYL